MKAIVLTIANVCAALAVPLLHSGQEGDIALRQTANYIEEGVLAAASPAKKPKYYFRIPLPLGKFNVDDILPMVQEGSILELVETRVSEKFDQLGLSNLRFGWDGRLNPSEAATDAGVIRLKSLFSDPNTMTLQFNVQGEFKPDVNQNTAKLAIELMQGDNKLADALSDTLGVVAEKMGLFERDDADQACSAPWKGENCMEYDDSGIQSLRAAVDELATFEGEHHSDFTIALLSHMDGLEKELQSELSTIAAAAGRTSQVAETCCGIFQAADGIASKFRFQVRSLKRTSVTDEMNQLENEKSCGLPPPHMPPASGTNVGDMETPLLSTMSTMYHRVQEWSKYMAGSHFATILTDKMNVVKYDLESLVHQSLIVLYNHDFVQERCGNLASSLRGLVDERHFNEFHQMLRVPKVDVDDMTLEVSQNDDAENLAP